MDLSAVLSMAGGGPDDDEPAGSCGEDEEDDFATALLLDPQNRGIWIGKCVRICAGFSIRGLLI